MISSDSQPIQFWPVGELTANEKDICGIVKQDCFCQPWQCDDEIIVQFQSSTPLKLQIIYPEEIPENILTENFTSSLGAFTSVAPGDDPWNWDSSNGGEATEGLIIFADNSEHLQATLSIVAATYNISIDFINGGIGTRGVTVEVYFGSDLVASQNVSISTASGTLEYEIENLLTYSTISFVVKSNPAGIAGEFSISKIVVDQLTDNVLEEIDLQEISTDVWQAEFVLNELSSLPICDQQVALRIISDFIENGEFTGTLSPWTNVTMGGTVDWAASSNKAQVTVGGASLSKALVQNGLNFTPGTYSFTIDFQILANTGNVYFIMTGGSHSLWIFNGATTPGEDPSSTAPESYGVGNHIVTRTFTTLHDYNLMYVQFAGGGIGAPQIKINTISVSPSGYELYKSDCLDIKTEQPYTELISYSNSSNFDGLIYSTSPPTTFNLRVPAIFFEENNPQEQEDLELSNGRIVTLRSTIQEKKLLDIGFCTNYMIKKIQKVLMHETIHIQDTFWKKRDSFDASPIKKYNLKRASVWLTKYNSVEKNTI